MSEFMQFVEERREEAKKIHDELGCERGIDECPYRCYMKICPKKQRQKPSRNV